MEPNTMTEPTNEKMISTAVAPSMEDGLCFLCDRSWAVLGCWHPSDEFVEIMSHDEYLYGLCRHCLSDDKSHELVAEAIIALEHLKESSN
jgi:hypothetical protein